MVTTTKAPSKTAATDSAAPKKAAAVKTTTAKTAAAKTPAVKPVIKTTFAPMPAPVAATPAVVTEKAVPAPAPVKATAKKPAVKKTAAAQTQLKPSTAPKPAMSSEQRNHYVAVAAFYIAERRGFTLGDPVNDWLAAEAEVDRLIGSGHFLG